MCCEQWKLINSLHCGCLPSLKRKKKMSSAGRSMAPMATLGPSSVWDINRALWASRPASATTCRRIKTLSADMNKWEYRAVYKEEYSFLGNTQNYVWCLCRQSNIQHVSWQLQGYYISLWGTVRSAVLDLLQSNILQVIVCTWLCILPLLDVIGGSSGVSGAFWSGWHASSQGGTEHGVLNLCQQPINTHSDSQLSFWWP